MSDTPRGLKLSCCGNHPDRTDLSCYKIRRLDGTALTVAEVWAELTAAQAEIAELRAKCERLLDAHNAISGTTMSHVANYEHGMERCRTIARTAIAEYNEPSQPRRRP